ncbi:MAG: hypothetical protein IPO92_22255 [Saprospiraceae bacterium]|nr:hypothetical protein [Saprospiraceae bacterium]
MNTNKILIAALIGGVFSFFFGWLVFGIIFKDAMNVPMEGFMKPESEFVLWAMVVSNLMWGLLMAYIFVQWANISTWMSGATAGAILGFLISAAYDFGFFAMTNMFTMSSMLTDIAVNTVYVGIMGAVVGWWLGRK